MSTPSFFQVTKSIFAAFIGVQSKANQVQDFTHGRPEIYIVVGIGITLVFILTLVFIVHLIIGA